MEQVKVIHRFWAGKRMPLEYVEYGRQWEELNPGWEEALWDEDSLEDFPELSDVFVSLYERDRGRLGVELYTQIADVLAYALVERYGGVYANVDIQPIRPLPELPQHAWASYENDINDVVNAIFGAPQPGDPFLQKLLKRLPEKYFENPTAEMVLTTGPALMTEMARQHPSEIFIFPKETFNPIHWSQVELGGDASGFIDQLPETTIALHHWGHKKIQRTNFVETATQA